ncbi:MAG: hypothetical protein IPL40_15285 [Proteobacteria bacterium]|nr:hypothetical protein [Pseudomonadota bacterium]
MRLLTRQPNRRRFRRCIAVVALLYAGAALAPAQLVAAAPAARPGPKANAKGGAKPDPKGARGAVPPARWFARCKEADANGQYAQAADACARYLNTAGKSAEKYESAQFFLANALDRLGLHHGAVEFYFQVANTRRTPELLPRAVRALEQLYLSRPIDEDMILRDLIGETDFGELPPELNDFVHYWQGITNLFRGLDEWANERFSRLSRRGYYYYLAVYSAGVRLLHADPPDRQRFAVRAFAELFGASDLAAALESLRRRGEIDAKLTLALKALVNDDGALDVRFERLPQGWELELALLAFGRVAAETGILLQRAKETDEDELGRPFAYDVEVGGIPVYRRAPRFEDRVGLIRAVAARPTAVRRLRGMALHSLSRLLYEQQRYSAAYDTLLQVPRGTELSSEILLERAWSKYRAGDPHRAMGLLYALDAPIYRGLFAPEKFVLRGLLYRRFCHFRAAKLAARRFRVLYDKALQQIRDGVPLVQIKAVRNAALRLGETRRRYIFGRTLRDELRRLEGYRERWAAGGLHSLLRHIYQQKLQQVRAELAVDLEASTRAVAEDMLSTQEQVNLLEYEVAQALFDRVSEGSGAAVLRKRTPPVPASSARVYYRFTQEYWTDELPFYKFNIEDRCVE